MLPFSIMTFWSLTQALSTFRRVLVARLTAMLAASSKLCSEVALNSVTRATVICTPSSLGFSLKLPSLHLRDANATGLFTELPRVTISGYLLRMAQETFQE